MVVVHIVQRGNLYLRFTLIWGIACSTVGLQVCVLQKKARQVLAQVSECTVLKNPRNFDLVSCFLLVTF